MNLKFKDELFVFLILHLKDIILLLKESTKNTPILYIKKELNVFELEMPKSPSINFKSYHVTFFTPILGYGIHRF